MGNTASGKSCLPTYYLGLYMALRGGQCKLKVAVLQVPFAAKGG